MPDRAPSLIPTERALHSLNLNIDPSKVFVIAGTNGKGSTAATLEALFLDAGFDTQLFTSPHLIESTERIRLNGKDISKEEFVRAFYKVSNQIETQHLTHFEMMTLMAAVVFFSAPSCERRVSIFEVGLGGTWDSTNAIPHLFSVITKIDFDHQNILGNSLVSIAQNKFGIVRDYDSIKADQHKVVVAPQDPSIEHLISKNWIRVSPPKFRTTQKPPSPETVLESPWGEARLSMLGKRAAENTLNALYAFEAFGMNPNNHLGALEKVRWPGRMDFLELNQRKIYFSGDHNPSGIDSLIEILEHFERDQLYILAGIGKHKDHHLILEKLFSIPKANVALTETTFQSCKLSDYHQNHQKRALFCDSDPRSALVRLITYSKDPQKDLILVTGSLYLVGFLRKAVLEERSQKTR